MAAVLLAGGIGFLLAGLLAIAFGIPVKEFSFGNTLIITGAVVACTGAIMLGLWIVVLELKNIGRRFGLGAPPESRVGAKLPPAGLNAALGDQTPEDSSFLFSRDQPVPDNAGYAGPPAHAPSPRPWHEEATSPEHVPAAPGQPVGAAPAVKPRRNLMFSTTSRKERERSEARTAEPSAIDLGLATPGPAFPVAPPPVELGEPLPATFDDAWPKSERTRAADVPLPRRGGREPTTFAEAGAGADRHPPPARSEDRPPVTVLKSGVVDGMAYSLYSDGSIEAQMPEGMMRFASIDELRSHLDQRS